MTGSGLRNRISRNETVVESDGTEGCIYSLKYFPYGGDLQFIDSSYELCLVGCEAFDSITLVDMTNVNLELTIKNCKIHDSKVDINVVSNNEYGVTFNYDSQKGICKAYKSHAIAAEDFIGWFNRETDELYSTDTSIDLVKASEEGVHFIEARFAERAEDVEVPTLKIGDINSDGDVNTADAVCILKDCVKSEMQIYDDYSRYDVDANGYINTGDAVSILRKCVEL